MATKYLLNFLIFSIVSLIFIAPMEVNGVYFYSEIRTLKTSWGVLISVFGLLLWLFYSHKSKALSIQYSKLYLPIFLFLLWCLISFIWSENIYLAIFNFVQYFSVGLIFFVVLNSFSLKKDMHRLVDALIISLIFVSLVGLLQFYFSDNYLVHRFFLQGASPASTFGNKNLASHFILMVLPLSFFLLLATKNVKKISLYTVAVFIATWYLLSINARQAYLALFVQLFIFLLFFTLDYLKNGNIFYKTILLKRVKFILILMISLSLFVISNTTSEGFNLDKGSKIQKIENISLEGGSSRISTWINSIEMIKDHPVRGVGIGQWHEHYPFYYDTAKKDILFGERARPAKLHNDYIEMVANLGIVGFFLLFWILVILIKLIWRVLSSNQPGREMVLGLALGLVGFSVVAFFSYPIWSYTPIFLLMIFIALIANISSNESRYVNLTRGVYKVFIVTITSVFLSSLYFSYKLNAAGYYYIKSTESYGKGDVLLAIKDIKQSIDLNPYKSSYYAKLALYLLNSKQSSEAIPFLVKANNLTLFNSEYLNSLQLAYGRVGDVKNREVVLRKILKYDSKNIKALTFIVQILFDQGKYDEANILYRKLKESFEYFKDRSNFGPYHKIITKLALKVQDYKYVSYIYKDLVKRRPTANNYAVYGVIEYQRLGNKPKARRLFLNAIRLNINVEIPQEIRDDLKL